MILRLRLISSLRWFKEMKELGVTNHKDINQKLSNEDAYKRARPTHVTLIVQTQKA